MDSSNNNEVSKVYAIAGEGGIKLGKSKEPARRLRDLQPSSPSKLELLTHADECEAINEKDLHRLFADSRMHFEWFDIDKDTVKIVFSGNDRIGVLMKMAPAKLGRVMRAYGKDSMADCVKAVAGSPEWLWLLSLAYSARSRKSRLRSKATARARAAANYLAIEDVLRDRDLDKKETRGRKALGKDKRTHTIKVSVNRSELIEIADRANKAGVAVAVYLRGLGLQSSGK